MIKPAKITPDDLERRVMRIKQLGANFEIVRQLIEIMKNEEMYSGHALAEFIEMDMALASRLVSLANSAYYKRLETISTVKQAVRQLGFKESLMLSIGIGFANILDHNSIPSQIPGKNLLAHNLAVSWTAGLVAKMVNHPNPDEVKISGLFHDIGKLLFATHMAKEYAGIFEMVENGIPYHEAEKQYGLLHESAGYFLAKKWGLPEVHLDAIRYHENPNKGTPYYINTCLLHIANSLVNFLGFGVTRNEKLTLEENILASCGLTVKHITRAGIEAKKDLPQVLNNWWATIKSGD